MAPGDKYSVNISDAELESFKETFMMFDKDGDGTVSTKGSLQVEKIKNEWKFPCQGVE